jgi:hypothetical protein
MRERIRNLYWSGSLHSDLRLQQPYTEVLSDDVEEDMQFSVSSQEAVSVTDGVTQTAANHTIHSVDSNSTEGNESRPSAVSEDEESRYRQSEPRIHKKADRFTEREYMRSDSDSDDEGTMHYSSRRDEDGPPPKRKRTSQRRGVDSRDPHTTREREGSKISSTSARREYWARKVGKRMTAD